MAEFLVETYAPRETPNAVAVHVQDVARAAAEVSQPEIEVRLLRAIFLPADETCFYHYQSSSADAVREAAARARLPLERITEAVSITALPASHHAIQPLASPNQPHITEPEET